MMGAQTRQGYVDLNAEGIKELPFLIKEALAFNEELAIGEKRTNANIIFKIEIQEDIQMKLRSSLIFNGQTEAAFNHYKTIFNGEFIGPLVRVKDTDPEQAGTAKGEKILYIALDLGHGQLLTGND